MAYRGVGEENEDVVRGRNKMTQDRASRSEEPAVSGAVAEIED